MYFIYTIKRNDTVTKHKGKEKCLHVGLHVSRWALNFATLRISFSAAGRCLTWGRNCYQVQLMVFLRKRETRKRPKGNTWHKLQRWKRVNLVPHIARKFLRWFLDKHTFFSFAFFFVFVFVLRKKGSKKKKRTNEGEGGWGRERERKVITGFAHPKSLTDFV